MKRSLGLHRSTAAAALGVAGLLVVAGCASRIAMDTERTLAAAGFHMKLADTPEKLAHLQTLEPQRRLVPHSQDDEANENASMNWDMYGTWGRWY